MAVPEKYSRIDFEPPEAVRENARRALVWIDEGLAGEGFTDVGRARAADLANDEYEPSPEIVRRMKAYFDRHQTDKDAEGFSFGEDGFPSPGRVAWDAWGGDEGYTWSTRIVRQMNDADEEAKMKNNQPSEHKTFPVFIKQIDESAGVVEAIVAVMGNVDYGMDIIHPGAFAKTIAENGHKVRVLDNHNAYSVLNVVGKPIEIREIGRDELPTELLERYPDATGGLYTKTQYLMDTPEGAGAFMRIKAGAVDEYSIGYDPIRSDYGKRKKEDGAEDTVRNLREVRLWEYSPVVFAMNPATATLGAKSATITGDKSFVLSELEKQFDGLDTNGNQYSITLSLATKGAIAPQDFPLGDRAAEWDGDMAEQRVRAWAGGPDDIDFDEYRRAFVWVDDEAPDLLGSYKLGVVDIVDGGPHVMPRGVFAAAAAVEGARTEIDIPDADMDGVRRTLSAYYNRMAEEFEDPGIVPPWDKAMNGIENEEENKQEPMSDGVQGCVRRALDELQKAVAMMDGEYEDEESMREEIDAEMLNAPTSNEAEPLKTLTSSVKPAELSPLDRQRAEEIRRAQDEIARWRDEF